MPFFPHCFINYTNKINSLVRHLLLHIARHRNAISAISIYFHCGINHFQKTFPINTVQYKISLIQYIRPSSADSDAQHLKGVPHSGKKKLFSPNNVPPLFATAEAFICQELKRSTVHDTTQINRAVYVSPNGVNDHSHKQPQRYNQGT